MDTYLEGEWGGGVEVSIEERRIKQKMVGKRQETKDRVQKKTNGKKLARVDSRTEAMRSDAFEREEFIMKTFSCRSQRSIAFNRVTIFPQPAIVIQ